MFKFKFTQGVTQRIRVYSPTATLFLKNPETILIFNTVVAENEQYWLEFKIDENNFIGAGICQFQLFDGDQLKDYGSCQIIPSLMVDQNQETRGKYAVIVSSIEAQLAGIATLAQKRVQVNDKSVDKYSAAELLSLLNYFKGKLAEEEAGNNVNPKTDQMKIKYVWSWR